METSPTKYERAVERGLTSKHTTEIVWEPDLDADLERTGILSVVNDELADIEIDGGWSDIGIGAYEFWGFRGHDSRMAVEVEDVPIVVLRLKGLDHVVPVPTKTLTLSYGGGGCDGEHPGRCRAACAEWEASIEWKVVHQELRGTDLYLVVEGAQT